VSKNYQTSRPMTSAELRLALPETVSVAIAEIAEDVQEVRGVPTFSLLPSRVSAVSNRLGAALGDSFLVVATRRSGESHRWVSSRTFLWHFATDRHPRYA